MKFEREDWLGLAASTLLIAGLLYLATCATASATEHEIRYRHESVGPIGALQVCQADRCVDVPAACNPSTECTAIVDLEPGVYPTVARIAYAPGAQWSPPSNVLEIRVRMPKAECLELDACAMDRDQDGKVGGTDFLRFWQAFGSGWP